jgi:hypothetical protein
MGDLTRKQRGALRRLLADCGEVNLEVNLVVSRDALRSLLDAAAERDELQREVLALADAWEDCAAHGQEDGAPEGWTNCQRHSAHALRGLLIP